MPKKRILVVEPHPDDGAIKAGGTLAKMTSEGHEAYFLTMTDGERGSMDRAVISPEQIRTLLREEGIRGSKLLGGIEDTFLGYPNHEVMPHLEIELREKIMESIRRLKPNIVMTYDPYALYEGNPDHRTVAFATYDAVSFSQHHLDFPEQVKRFGTHLVDEIWFFATPHPNLTVDVTETIWTKAKAMAAYKSPMESMLEEVKQRLKAAGLRSSYLESGPLEEILMKMFATQYEDGRYVEKFKVIRPFISERVPHLLSEGLIEPIKE